MFPDVETVRSVQQELDLLIEDGVGNIVQLLRNSESGTSSKKYKLEAESEAKSQQQKYKLKRFINQSDKIKTRALSAYKSALSDNPRSVFVLDGS